MKWARGGNFDYRLFEKEEICLLLLRSAAEQIALARAWAPDAHTIAAVLLRVLSADWSGCNFGDERREKVRSLEDWISLVSTPEAECSNLLKSPDSESVAASVSAVLDVIVPATISWGTGSPEDPPTELTARRVVDALLHLGMLRRIPRAGL